MQLRFTHLLMQTTCWKISCGSAGADKRNKQQLNNIIKPLRLSAAVCVVVQCLSVVLSVCVFVQEMYSKGMILASGVRQVRGLGDNKFEVVTSLRTFIFRAEREGTGRPLLFCV